MLRVIAWGRLVAPSLLPWPRGQRARARQEWGDRLAPSNSPGKGKQLGERKSVVRTDFSLKSRGVQENWATVARAQEKWDVSTCVSSRRENEAPLRRRPRKCPLPCWRR